MEGLFVLSLFFVWGVTLFDAAGETVIKTTHDEWMDFGSTSAARHADIIELCESFGLERLS